MDMLSLMQMMQMMHQRPRSVLPEGISHKVVFNNGSGIVGIVSKRQGYVAFPKDHPYNGLSENDSGNFPKVHGGITWWGNLPDDIHNELNLENYYSIGWDYNHFSNSSEQQHCISNDISPTFQIISDEVLMVCQKALELSNNS